MPSLEEVLEIEPAPEVVPDHSAFASIKHEIAAFLHRLNASDAATGIHVVTSSGGGRVSTLAAIVAFCLSGVTAGTVCVVTGLIPDPIDTVRPERPHAERRPDAPRERPRRSEPEQPAPLLATEVTPVRPTPTPTPAPERSEPPDRRPARTSDPAQGTGPKSHENAPISPAAVTASSASAGGQETFTPEAPSSPTEPAAAPATGGGEFTP